MCCYPLYVQSLLNSYGDTDEGQIGSGNGLLFDVTKSLPEPMLIGY